MSRDRSADPVATATSSADGRGTDAPALEGVSVVVVTHNSNDVLDQCLLSLPPEVEAIVVDNASATAPTAGDRDGARTVVIRNDVNLGYGAALNIGARAAQGRDLLLINPDIRFAPGAIAALLRRRDAEPSDCAVGPSIWSDAGDLLAVCRRASRVSVDLLSLLPYIGLRLPRRFHDDLPPGHPVYTEGGRVDYLQGCCLLVSKRAFDRVGGFDAGFFLYSEEEDLCLRLRRIGVPSVYEPAAQVVHLWGASTAKARPLAVEHEFRSRVLFHRKHGGVGAAETYRVGALTAVALHLALLPIQRLLHRSPERDRAWCLAALRGLAGAPSRP